MKRQVCKGLMFWTVITIITFFSGATPGLAGPKYEKVRLLYTDSVYSLTSIVAQELGYFIEEGLAVNGTPLPYGGLAVMGLVGGSADFSVGAYSRFLAAVNEDLPVKAIGITGYGFQGYVIVPPKSTAKSIEDLKGKKLAVQMGSGTSSIFLRYLKAKGLHAKDFTVKNMDTEMIPATFQAGGVDGGVPWDPYATQIVAKGLGKVIISNTEMAKVAGATYAFPLMTHEKIIKNRPEMVAKFCRAWVKAMKFIQEKPEEAVDILHVAFVNQVGLSVNKDAVRKMIQTTYYDRSTFNEQDQKDAYKSGEIFVEYGFKLKKAPTMAQIKAHVDNSFMEKAEKAVR